MTSEKRLSSVCHSVAHHAVSGLSYLHPHLKRACRANGLSEVSLDLISDLPLPASLVASEELHLAVASLRARFAQILESEGFALTDLRTAWLLFKFPGYRDDYCSGCHARLVSQNGREFMSAVNYLGNSIAPVFPSE
jgi:hypothetical protein